MIKTLRFAAATVGMLSVLACSYDKKAIEGEDSNPPVGENKISGPATGGTAQCGEGNDCTGPIVVSASVVHKRGVPYTNDGDFVFNAESHAVVRLYFAEGADALSETVREIRFSQLKELPLVFAIAGDPALIFQRQGDYGIQVQVQSRAGDENRVGDLVSEMHYGVSSQTAGLTVEVTGLEACDSQGAGGFCTTIGAP